MGSVVQWLADSIEATGAGTGVATLKVNAGHVVGALGIGGALGSTGGWSTKVIRQAAANGLTLLILALSIRTAG